MRMGAGIGPGENNLLDKWPFGSRVRWGEGVHGHGGGEGSALGAGAREEEGGRGCLGNEWESPGIVTGWGCELILEGGGGRIRD